MKKLISLLLVIILVLGVLPVSAAEPVDGLWEAFETPAADAKSRPLFFWNDQVANMTPETLRELMVRSFEESGYSGFGILPNWLSAYMSEEYMALYRVALETAKEYGMKMCLYDENGFPSGSAGGILAKTYPEATAKRLDKQEWTVTGPQTFTTPVRADGKVMGAVAMNTATREIVEIPDGLDLVTGTGIGLYASTYYGEGYTVDMAFDGNYNTRWNSAAGAMDNQWIEVNYGKDVTVDKIVVREAYARIGGYKLQYHNGEDWVNILTGTGVGDLKTWTFDAVTADRFRLFIDGITASTSSSIWEMELYNGNEKLPSPDMVTDTLTWDVPAGEWKIMVFNVVRDGYDRVDYLDADCVDKFIEVTHDAYYEEFSEYFGTVIDSAFYDEPPLYQTEGGRMWTEKFNEKFEAKYGFDPITLYPALWYDIGENTLAARNYLFEFRADLFTNEYIKRMSDWCHDHGITLTGHMDQEENVNPTSTSGDLMKVFSQQDAPGVDEISRYRRAEKAYKIVSSSAYNWDKGLVMTEIYGAMGEGMGVDVLYKDIMDEMAKGINLVVPHAIWYNNKANVQNPPELSYRSAQYGPVLPAYNNYIGRSQALLQNGRHVADIAVMYPIDTLNGGYYFDGSSNPFSTPYVGITPEEADYMDVGEFLSTTLRRDYTFLHPEILEERVSVDGSVMNLNNEVNYEQYQVFVMPGQKIISYDSLLKIKEFYDNGGKVIATTQLPYLATDPQYNDEVVAIITEMFGIDPTSKEGKVTYSASSIFSGGYIADYAFDGVYGNGSRWNAGDQSVGDEWIEVDFGREVTLNRTVLTENVPYFRVNSYAIQYWDGTQWQNACTGTNIGDHHEDKFEAVTTNKLRLYVNTLVNNKDSVSIEEFEVYYNDSENLALERPFQPVANTNDNGGKAWFLGKDYQSTLQSVLDEAVSVYDVEIDPVSVANDGNFAYIHKVKDEREIYFFANSTSTPINTWVNLRGELVPELWDPYTGERSEAEYTYVEEDGEVYTRVNLQLSKIDSTFVVAEPASKTVELSVTGDARAEIRDEAVSYTVSAENMENLATVLLKLDVDDEYLANVAAEAAEGWYLIFQQYKDGVLSVALGNNEGANGDGVLMTVTGTPTGKTGTYRVAITEARMAAFEGEGEINVEAQLGEAFETTMEENRFDVNKDGVVDQRDMTRAQRYFGSTPDSENWNADADVDRNGEVDINDIVLILQQFNSAFAE